MAYSVLFGDVIFIEGGHPAAVRGPAVQCDLSFKFGAQLKSLRDVKEDLCKQAKAAGFNAVLDFTYGQKSRWLAIDDVAYWGKGCLAKLSENDYNTVRETIINRN